MAKKFVINDGDLIIGHVELHEDLVKGMDRNKTIGGGYWYFDREKNIVYFYGKSLDFGTVSEDELRAAFKQSSIEDATIVFSEKETLCDVLVEQHNKI